VHRLEQNFRHLHFGCKNLQQQIPHLVVFNFIVPEFQAGRPFNFLDKLLQNFFDLFFPSQCGIIAPDLYLFFKILPCFCPLALFAFGRPSCDILNLLTSREIVIWLVPSSHAALLCELSLLSASTTCFLEM